MPQGSKLDPFYFVLCFKLLQKVFATIKHFLNKHLLPRNNQEESEVLIGRHWIKQAYWSSLSMISGVWSIGSTHHWGLAHSKQSETEGRHRWSNIRLGRHVSQSSSGLGEGGDDQNQDGCHGNCCHDQVPAIRITLQRQRDEKWAWLKQISTICFSRVFFFARLTLTMNFNAESSNTVNCCKLVLIKKRCI